VNLSLFQAERALNCKGGVSPLSARMFSAPTVSSLMSEVLSRKKETTHVLHAIAAMVQVEQSMIMQQRYREPLTRILAGK
jgi:hypothetical protein